MCTLILAWQVFEGVPVVAAANRDEALDRPSEKPAFRDWEKRVVAPVDQQAGGTWIGYNEHGVFVAITNRWLDVDITGDRSRGLLVRDALGADSAEKAVRTVERELDERTYDGFYLVVADATGAFFVESGPYPRITTFQPGVHVVVNVGANGSYSIPGRRMEVGEQQAENANIIRTALQPEPGEPPEQWRSRASEALGNHEYGVCVHGDGFGTKSASLLTLSEEERFYEYASGPPCETPFEPVEDSV